MLDDDEEVLVSFIYEKLPNICYWCGMVCHDDKDCDIWLSSKGSLSIEPQEFGAWMRASPFNLGRKTFCSILGKHHLGHHPAPLLTRKTLQWIRS